MKPLRSVAALLLLSGLACAAPVRRVLVLQADGPPGKLRSGSFSSSVSTGSILQEKDQVELPAGASVSVLVLGKKQRLKVSGPGKLLISSAGVESQGAAVEAQTSPEPLLAFHGDSTRRLAGVRTRAEHVDAYAPGFDSVRVEPGSPGTLVLSAPASSAWSGPVEVAFSPEFVPPVIDDHGVARESPETPVKQLQLQPVREGERWVVRAPLPAGTREYTVQAHDAGGHELLYARAVALGADDAAQLSAARAELQKWRADEPQSPAPLVTEAALLEDYGMLGEALQTVNQALQLRPDDPGLLQARTRLQLDSGNYPAAVGAFRP